MVEKRDVSWPVRVSGDSLPIESGPHAGQCSEFAFEDSSCACEDVPLDLVNQPDYLIGLAAGASGDPVRMVVTDAGPTDHKATEAELVNDRAGRAAVDGEPDAPRRSAGSGLACSACRPEMLDLGVEPRWIVPRCTDECRAGHYPLVRQCDAPVANCESGGGVGVLGSGRIEPLDGSQPVGDAGSAGSPDAAVHDNSATEKARDDGEELQPAYTRIRSASRDLRECCARLGGDEALGSIDLDAR